MITQHIPYCNPSSTANTRREKNSVRCCKFWGFGKIGIWDRDGDCRRRRINLLRSLVEQRRKRGAQRSINGKRFFMQFCRLDPPVCDSSKRFVFLDDRFCFGAARRLRLNEVVQKKQDVQNYSPRKCGAIKSEAFVFPAFSAYV